MATSSTRRALLVPGGIAGLSRLIAPGIGAGTEKQVSVARRAMGCEFSLIFPGEFRAACDAGCRALDVVDSLEQKLSVFRPDSEMSFVNRTAAASSVQADPEVYDLLRMAARTSRETAGAFDAASGALVRAWGYLHGPRRVPEEPERLAALRSSGSALVALDDEARTVRFLRDGVEFNLGGVGKGYAIDLALDRIRTGFGVRCALMQAGESSFKAVGAPRCEPRGWKVAIADPTRPSRRAAVVWLKNRALGTSGTAHQFFDSGGRRYGHILDPRTGWPADRVAGASAIADSAAKADALSTAFFVMGVEGARRYCLDHPGAGAVLVLKPKPQAVPEVLVFGAANAEVLL